MVSRAWWARASGFDHGVRGLGFLVCRGGSIITGAGVGVLRASIITDKLPLFYLASCFPLLEYSVFVVLLCGIQYPWFAGLVLCVRGGSSRGGMASRVQGSGFAVRGSGFGLAWYGRPGAGGWWGRAGREAKK